MSIHSLTNDIKTDILFKKFLNKTSTSANIDYFAETETPESRTTIFPHFQLYAQADEIPDNPPTDIINLESGNDDIGNTFLGSYIGKTSTTHTILKKYYKINLVNISTSCGKAFQAPNCVNVSSITGSGFQINEVLKGDNSGARGIIILLTSTEIYFKNIGGYHINFELNETVRGLTTSTTATLISIPGNCLTHRVLRDTIPQDFGDGTYNCKLYKQNGDRIYFGDGDWILDPHSGVITFYGNLPSSVSSILPPKITFYRYIGKKGLNTSHTPTGNVGIGTKLPLVSLDIDRTDCIRIPVGDNSQRPGTGKTGYIRYNNQFNIYEGYRIDGLGNGIWDDLTKGLGTDSNNVNIGTGGRDRVINIGNTVGNSGIILTGGSNGVTINSTSKINIDSNDRVNIGTSSSTNKIVIGSSSNDVSISLVATGNNSSINLEGPISMNGEPFYFANPLTDGNWRLQQGTFEGNSVLLVQKKIGSSYKTRQIFS